MPWGPLGGGFLTGRLQRDTPVAPGSRLSDAPAGAEEALHRRATERNWRTADEARAVAGELGATVPQVAIAWLLHQPGVSSPVLGARTAEHLEDLLAAAWLRLDDVQLARLGAAAPPPTVYPHRMLAQDGLASERPLRRSGTPVARA
jgi:aryl-alcohol dehydrogenase-like predicted oxidoreductase